ncbi:MAG TPA: VOC family protein [Stellaceae bacterium]|nr:VOC family protein [Stellaceae bacterium]
MVTLAEVTAKRIGKAPSSVVKPVALGRGTMATRDLALTRKFLEDALGMECRETAPGHLLARHRGDRGANSYWILEVTEAPRIDHPQKMLNHWGFEVATRADVERVHQLLTANAEAYGLRRVHPVKANHGSFSFYCEDVDSNWWEVECRDAEISYAASVAKGDPA